MSQFRILQELSPSDNTLCLFFHKGIQKTLRRYKRTTKKDEDRKLVSFFIRVFRTSSVPAEDFGLIPFTLYSGTSKPETMGPLPSAFIQGLEGRCLVLDLQWWPQVWSMTVNASWMKEINVISQQMHVWRDCCTAGSVLAWDCQILLHGWLEWSHWGDQSSGRALKRAGAGSIIGSIRTSPLYGWAWAWFHAASAM